jgi:peptidylprolyl isomerase
MAVRMAKVWQILSSTLAGVFIGAGGTYVTLTRDLGASPPIPVVATAPPADSLGLARLETLLAAAEPAERAAVLETPETFANFVAQEATNQSILRAAYAKAVDHGPGVATLMVRAAQRVLAETYLGEVLRSRVASEGPSDADLRVYYDANPERFQVGERVHLWQIFLPATTSTERLNAQALGRRLLEDLLSAKADFAALATRHSLHPQSRLNGGYMGLHAYTELKPEIRQAVENATPGKPAGPVESADGVHLVLRGDSVPASQIAFEDAAPRIRELLRRERAAEARRTAVEEIAAEHPIDYDREALETWRETLRTRTTENPPASP